MRLAHRERVSDHRNICVLCDEKWWLKLNLTIFCAHCKFLDSLFSFRVNQNQTLYNQNTNKNWMSLTVKNRNSTVAYFCNLSKESFVNFCVEIKLIFFIYLAKRLKDILNINLFHWHYSSHHVYKRVVKTFNCGWQSMNFFKSFFWVQEDQSLQLIIIKALNFVFAHHPVEELSERPWKRRC